MLKKRLLFLPLPLVSLPILTVAVSCGQDEAPSQTPSQERIATDDYPTTTDQFVSVLTSRASSIKLTGNMHDLKGIEVPRELTHIDSSGNFSAAGETPVLTWNFRLAIAGANATFLPAEVFKLYLAEKLVFENDALWEVKLEGPNVNLTALYGSSFGFDKQIAALPLFDETFSPLSIQAQMKMLPGFYTDAQEIVRAALPDTTQLAPYLKLKDYFKVSAFSINAQGMLGFSTSKAAQFKSFFKDMHFIYGDYATAAALPELTNESWISVKAYDGKPNENWSRLGLIDQTSSKRLWVSITPKDTVSSHVIDQTLFDLTSLISQVVKQS